MKGALAGFRSVPSWHPHIGRCPALRETRADDRRSFGSWHCRERHFSHPLFAHWSIKDVKHPRERCCGREYLVERHVFRQGHPSSINPAEATTLKNVLHSVEHDESLSRNKLRSLAAETFDRQAGCHHRVCLAHRVNACLRLDAPSRHTVERLKIVIHMFILDLFDSAHVAQ